MNGPTVMRANQLDVDRAFVLVIDMQEKILPLVQHAQRITACCLKLLDGARVLALPVLATEQYPQGIGPTVGPIRDALHTGGASPVEKPCFSAWAEPATRDAIRSIDRPQVILVGIETHVCVQQTTLDLLSRDYDVFVCADAVGSRGPIDHRCAIDRMRQEGAWVTTVEAVLFELCQRTDAPHFRGLLEVIKKTPPATV